LLWLMAWNGHQDHWEFALDADVRLTPGYELGSVGFETHAA